jgi:hypothetical protein
LGSGIFARIIDADFFVTHFVLFPIMRLVAGNALFLGSNALLQTSVLQSIDFNPRMQTEDIDVGVRLLLHKQRIDLCPESRSGELAPASFGAFYKQRLRWAIGWDQVSLALRQKFASSDAQRKRKVALAYICWYRWFNCIIGVAMPILTLVMDFYDYDLCHGLHCAVAIDWLKSWLVYLYFMLVTCCVFEACYQTEHRGLQSWLQVISVFVFMLAGPCNMFLQAMLIVVSLFKISTGTVRGWAVTARSVPPTQAGTQRHGLWLATKHAGTQTAEDDEASTFAICSDLDEASLEGCSDVESQRQAEDQIREASTELPAVQPSKQPLLTVSAGGE